MVTFNLDIDLYFWLIDRGDFEDDQRNKVEIEQNRVKLHREHAQRIENGFYFGKLMQVIRKTIIKKSKKPFTLDPQLLTMKDQTSTTTKNYNWSLVVVELKKFNIRVSKDTKTQLISGKHSAMHDLLQQLYEYDQALLAYHVADGGPSNRKADNHSELNFPSNDNVLERGQPGRFVQDADSQAHYPNGDLPRYGSGYIHPASILQGAPTKRASLDPIYNKLNKSPTTNILGYEDFVEFPSNDGYNPSYINQQLDNLQVPDGEDRTNQPWTIPGTGYTGHRSGLADSTSTLDFILEGLSQALGMSQSQAAALLANSQKYLMHMCVKGMKGQDYSKLLIWYQVTMQFAWRLIELLDFEKDDSRALSMTFNVLKCGLFSTNQEVSNICARTLNKCASLIHERQDAGPLKSMLWEWFVTSQTTDAPSALPPVQSPTKLAKTMKNQKELEELVQEAGLRGFIRAHRLHQNEFVEVMTSSVIQFGKDNYIEFFTHHMKLQVDNEIEFYRLHQDIFPTITGTSKGRAALIDSGAFKMVIDQTLQQGDQIQADSSIEKKQVYLALLVDFWKQKPEVIQHSSYNGNLTNAIIRILKNSMRDTKSRAVVTTAMNLTFLLLDGFASERNMFAPIIYKALTFLMIDCYSNLELREEMLKNFVQLFKQHQNIPITILCDPLLKQININLEKQDSADQNKNLLEAVSEHFTLNTTDFELFLAISNHQKLTVNIAIQLLEIVSTIARKNIIFTRVSLKILLTILARFETNNVVFEWCQSLVSKLLGIIYDQDIAKVELYHSLKNGPKNRKKSRGSVGGNGFNGLANQNTYNIKYKSPEKNGREFIDDSKLIAILNNPQLQDENSQYMSMKTSEKLIVNLLQCLSQTRIKILADHIRQQLIDSFIKTESKLRFQNKGIQYLLGFFDKDVSNVLQFSKQQQAKERTQKAKMKQAEREMEQRAALDQRARDAANRSFDYGNNELNANSLALLDMQNYNPVIPLNNGLLSVPNQRNPAVYVDRALQGYTDDDSFQRDPQNPRYNIENYKLRAQDDFGEGMKKYGNLVGTLSPKVTNKRNQSVPNDDENSNKKLRLFEISEAGPIDQESYLLWVKEKIKIYRAMFGKYAAASKQGGVATQTFDTMKKEKRTMTLASVFKFMSEFKINKEEAQRPDIKRMIILINLKQESNLNSASGLNLEGFIEFILQLGFHLYRDVSNSPQEFLSILFDRFREVSLSSKAPFFQKYFEEPITLSPSNDPQTLRRLTDLVNRDPNYELPPGYVKSPVDDYFEVDGPDPRKYPHESQRVAVGVLDDLFGSIFQMPLVPPRIEYQRYWVVQPDQNITPLRNNSIANVAQTNRYGVGHRSPEPFRLGSLDPKSGKASDYHNRRGTIDDQNQVRRYNYGTTNTSRSYVDELINSADVRKARGSKVKGSYPRPLNKLMELKIEKQQKDLNDNYLKQQRQARRQEKIKEKLAEYKEEKKAEEALKVQIKMEEIEKKKQKEKLKEQKKKEYYDQLKRNYEEERLPEIRNNKLAQRELVEYQRLQKRKRKESAQIKISENTQQLRQKFHQDALQRNQQSNAQTQRQRQEQEAVRRKRDQLARRATRSNSSLNRSLSKKSINRLYESYNPQYKKAQTISKTPIPQRPKVDRFRTQRGTGQKPQNLQTIREELPPMTRREQLLNDPKYRDFGGGDSLLMPSPQKTRNTNANTQLIH